MRAWSVLGNSQRLDGGAMFGNAPRALWQRWTTADAEGRIPLACRTLLLDDPAHGWILCETGIGSFFAPKMRERFGVVESEHVLLSSLEAAGVTHRDIAVVVLSHLHFDHVGGLLEPFADDSPQRLLFPNARFIVSRAAFERARAPHRRDRASFIEGLPKLLEDSGRLEIVDDELPLGEGYRAHFSDGHTPGLMLLEIPGDDGPVLFASDLIPGAPWMHLPITMGYDRYPERLIDEKERLLDDLQRRGGRVVFTHDPEVALGTIARDDRGRFCVKDRLADSDVVGVTL